MHWGGSSEVIISGISPESFVTAMYDSFVVNTTTYRSIMTGWAAVNLGDLTEAADHSTSAFSDVNDPDTTRVESVNTDTTRSVVLH